MAKVASLSQGHLCSEAILRIEVSLSSRKSSAVVFNTTCRLYSLEGGDWREIACGAPCVALVRNTTAPDSAFRVYIVIAEIESGLPVWKLEIRPENAYKELQPTYHSFQTGGKNMVLNLADEKQAGSLVHSLQQYLEQKDQVDRLLEHRRRVSEFTSKTEKGRNPKKGKLQKPRLSKSDISLPCDFHHLSGHKLKLVDECDEGDIEQTVKDGKDDLNVTDSVELVAESHKECVSSCAPDCKESTTVHSLHPTTPKASVVDMKNVLEDSILNWSPKYTVPKPTFFHNPSEGKEATITSAEPVKEVPTGWDEQGSFLGAKNSAFQGQSTSPTKPPLHLEKEPVSTQRTLLSSPTEPIPPREISPTGLNTEVHTYPQHHLIHSNSVNQERAILPSRTSQSVSTCLEKQTPRELQGTFRPPLATCVVQPSMDGKLSDMMLPVEKKYPLHPTEKSDVVRPTLAYPSERSGVGRPVLAHRALSNKQLVKRQPNIERQTSVTTTYSPVKHVPTRRATFSHSAPPRRFTPMQRAPIRNPNPSSSSVDHITNELSRVLRGFDDLITPTTSAPKHSHTFV